MKTNVTCNKKSPERSPAKSAWLFFSTTSKYCSDGKSAVGVKSSITWVPERAITHARTIETSQSRLHTRGFYSSSSSSVSSWAQFPGIGRHEPQLCSEWDECLYVLLKNINQRQINDCNSYTVGLLRFILAIYMYLWFLCFCCAFTHLNATKWSDYIHVYWTENRSFS